jgi:hypothetical protein
MLPHSARTLTALLAIAAVQVLTGCNPTPSTSTGAPAPAPAAPIPALTGSKSTIRLHPPDKTHADWYTAHAVASLDVVTWKSKTDFYVQFDQGANPCGPDVNGGGANIYNAIADPNNPGRFIATCTINNLGATPPWQYQVVTVTATTPKKTVPAPALPHDFNVTPCNGCLLEQDN